MDAETLLRRALNALNSTPSFSIFEGERRTTSYKLAAEIDHYFEPAVFVCRLLEDLTLSAAIGVGLDQDAARQDAVRCFGVRYHRSQISVEAALECGAITAGYDGHVLRASNPPPKIPEAK